MDAIIYHTTAILTITQTDIDTPSLLFPLPAFPFVVPVKVRTWFNRPRTNGVAVEQGNSPTLRLGGSLFEFSDRPLPIRQTGAPVQHGFSKVGTDYDENLVEQEWRRLEMSQEFEQLRAEPVQVDSVLVVDGTIGIGTY